MKVSIHTFADTQVPFADAVNVAASFLTNSYRFSGPGPVYERMGTAVTSVAEYQQGQ